MEVTRWSWVTEGLAGRVTSLIGLFERIPPLMGLPSMK